MHTVSSTNNCANNEDMGLTNNLKSKSHLQIELSFDYLKKKCFIRYTDMIQLLPDTSQRFRLTSSILAPHFAAVMQMCDYRILSVNRGINATVLSQQQCPLT